MSTLRIDKGRLPDIVRVPSSKSYANRALILGALKNSPVTISNIPEATDVTFLIEALKKTGLKISQSESEVRIENSFPDCESGDVVIDAGEGGTTARFLAALLLLGKCRYTLSLGKRLRDRPWSEFIDAARNMGAQAELTEDRLIVQGPLRKPVTLEVDCSRTTQFATAFDLSLKDTRIIPLQLKSSLSYWNMNAPLKEHFLRNDSYVVPADWSSASYPMTFAALNHQISFPGLSVDHFQADAKLAGVLETLGSLRTGQEGMEVFPGSRHSHISLDMSDCLDLFPSMCFLLSHIHGTHRLSGLGNLAHKESDRLNEVCRVLTAFGRDYLISGEVLTITGNDKICGERHLELPDDHRIVMTGALFLRHHQGGTLTSPDSVNKSYPRFFDLLK